MRLGSDVERLVLSRAVLWHCEDRIIRYGNQTVIFYEGSGGSENLQWAR